VAEVKQKRQELFRGLPDTGFIEDPQLRRSIDAANEAILWLLRRTDEVGDEYVFEPGDGIGIRVTEKSKGVQNVFVENTQEEYVPPEEEPEEFLVYNDYGSDIPAYSALEVTGVNEEGIKEVTRPTEDNLNPALVVFNTLPISSGEAGPAQNAFDVDAIFTYASSEPSVGDELGTQADDFTMEVGNQGFIYQGTHDDTYDLGLVRPSATAAAGYDGPFKVVKASDTTVDVQGYNVGASRLFRNYVILGSNTAEELAETTGVTITAECYVCLKITYVASAYVLAVVAVASGSFDSVQSATEYYIPLAFVKWDGTGAIIDGTPLQLQFGIIEGTGRAF